MIALLSAFFPLDPRFHGDDDLIKLCDVSLLRGSTALTANGGTLLLLTISGQSYRRGLQQPQADRGPDLTTG
jgi:hypothetical protein